MHTILLNWTQAVYALGMIFLAGIAGLVALGYFRKTQVEMSRQTVGLLNDRIAALEQQGRQLTSEGTELTKAYRLQEKRLYRMEVNDQRKGRQLKAARMEIDLLNEIVRISMTALTRMNAAEKEQVSSLMTQVAAHRIQSSSDHADWEEQQEAGLIFLDRQIDNLIVPTLAIERTARTEG